MERIVIGRWILERPGSVRDYPGANPGLGEAPGGDFGAKEAPQGLAVL